MSTSSDPNDLCNLNSSGNASDLGAERVKRTEQSDQMETDRAKGGFKGGIPAEPKRADLVAYLDGELTGEAARKIEAKLSLNAEFRAEADSLKRAWDLLDFLPRPEPSSTFTHRTLSRLVPISAAAIQPSPSGISGSSGAGSGIELLSVPTTSLALESPPSPRKWLSRAGWAGWAAGLALSFTGGYAGFHLVHPHEPGEAELVRDLRLIENKRFYDLVDDLDFLKQLAHPDLFGDEPPVLPGN